MNKQAVYEQVGVVGTLSRGLLLTFALVPGKSCKAQQQLTL